MGVVRVKGVGGCRVEWWGQGMGVKGWGGGGQGVVELRAGEVKGYLDQGVGYYSQG